MTNKISTIRLYTTTLKQERRRKSRFPIMFPLSSFQILSFRSFPSLPPSFLPSSPREYYPPLLHPLVTAQDGWWCMGGAGHEHSVLPRAETNSSQLYFWRERGRSASPFLQAQCNITLMHVFPFFTCCCP